MCLFELEGGITGLLELEVPAQAFEKKWRVLTCFLDHR